MVTFRLAPARLPAGTRVYAVGDVHGMARRLAALHRAIARDLAARPIARPSIIYLGDAIDRGPRSAEVMAWLAAGPPVGGMAMVTLRGNHEAMALAALASEAPEARAHWLANGAAATLASWGADPAASAASWAEAIPSEQLRLLQRLALTHREGGYLFVHAGVRPGVSLAAQEPEDLVWIREPFLSYRGDYGAVIVHGHTPTPEPIVRKNRIGIDTGCVYGGLLTVLILEADQLAFLQA